MKIYLKKGRADFINPYKEPSQFFVGREKEVQHLTNTILYNRGWSILIWGERGSGKTSFVYRVIQELTSKSEKKVIPIIVNVLQLSEGKINKEQLIKQIITNLYLSIDKLGIKALLEIKQEITNLQKLIIWKYSLKEELLTKKDFWVDWRIALKQIMIFLFWIAGIIGWIIWISFSSILDWLMDFIKPNYSRVIKILWWIFLGLWSFLSFSYTWKISKSTKESYILDNSIPVLEYKLSQFLEKRQKDYKFVFIVDELDKLDKQEELEEDRKSFEFIKTYKNLFTISDAFFIFVVDENQYNRMHTYKNQNHLNSTIFNYYYFLTLPSYLEIIDYIERIIDSKYENEEELHNLAIYLFLRWRLSFFHTKEFIHRRSKYDWDKQYVSVSLKFNTRRIKILRICLKSKFFEKMEDDYNYKKRILSDFIPLFCKDNGRIEIKPKYEHIDDINHIVGNLLLNDHIQQYDPEDERDYSEEAEIERMKERNPDWDISADEPKYFKWKT